MAFELTDEEGVFLVKLARRAIEEYLKTYETISPPEDTPEKLWQKCGVFVTLNTIQYGSKELRGCIGYPYPTNPLVEAAIDSAISSAVNDPRFPPVTLDEMDHIVVEVSVLTPPELIKVSDPREYPQHVRIGMDGLIVERSWRRGLLLPQVPIEWGWCPEEFLCQCCIKAGLPPDTWLIGGTKIYRFQAIIFEETSPRGEVVRVSLQEHR